MANKEPKVQITYNYGPADFAALWRLHGGNVPSTPWYRLITILFAWVLIGVGLIVTFDFLGIGRIAVPFIVGVCVGWVLIIIYSRYQLYRLQAKSPYSNYAVTFRAFEDRVDWTVGPVRQEWKWTGISEIVEDRDHVFVLYSDRYGDIVPQRAFESEDQKMAFVSFARARIASASSPLPGT